MDMNPERHMRMNPQDRELAISPNAGTTSPSPIGWERAGVRAVMAHPSMRELFAKLPK